MSYKCNEDALSLPNKTFEPPTLEEGWDEIIIKKTDA